MFDKTKNFLQHPTVRQLKDVRVLGFIVFAVLVLLVSWSGVGAIQTNFDLQKKISKLEQQNQVQELQNQNLKLKNEYFKTDAYLELTARRQFGKALPGEQVILVPKSVALRHVANDNVRHSNTKGQQAQKPFYQRNFEAWMDFFLHRPLSADS